jgi:hypothetical protein
MACLDLVHKADHGRDLVRRGGHPEAVAADRLTAPHQPILLVNVWIAERDMSAQQGRLRQEQTDQHALAHARLPTDTDEAALGELDRQGRAAVVPDLRRIQSIEEMEVDIRKAAGMTKHAGRFTML